MCAFTNPLGYPRSLAASSFFLLALPIAAQTTHNVPASYATIQAAISASQNGDTVLVAPGTYAEHINFNGLAITVVSSGGAASTTIDGTNSGRVVTFNSSEGRTSVLDGFTITNGRSADGATGGVGGAPGEPGGGILCQDTSPTIQNCVITGNTTGNGHSGSTGGGCGGPGGGIAILGLSSSPLIQGCTISHNTTGLGGHGGTGGGEGGFGAGIYSSGGFQGMSIGLNAPEISNCTINNNVTGNGGSGGTGGGFGGNGGGIYVEGLQITAGHEPKITDCVIQANQTGTGGAGGTAAGGAGDGAGIFCGSIGGEFVRCTISHNTTGSSSGFAMAGGGGVMIVGQRNPQCPGPNCPNPLNTQPRFDGCSITSNTSRSGSGILLQGAEAVLVNLVVTGNGLPPGAGSGSPFSPAAVIGMGGGFSPNPNPPPVTVTMTNCTVTKNLAVGQDVIAVGSGVDLQLANSIVWDNHGSSIYLFAVPGPNPNQPPSSGQATVSYCDIEGGYVGASNFDANPQWVDWSNGDLQLTSGSPCINVGSPGAASLPSRDRAGNCRVSGPFPDIGAYEFPTVYGETAACGNPALQLKHENPPILGTTASVLIEDAWTTIAAVALGFDNQFDAATSAPLPRDLSPLGFTGCSQITSADWQAPATATTNIGQLRFEQVLPNAPIFAGVELYLQAVCYAPGMNPGNVIVSNGVLWNLCQ